MTFHLPLHEGFLLVKYEMLQNINYWLWIGSSSATRQEVTCSTEDCQSMARQRMATYFCTGKSTIFFKLAGKWQVGRESEREDDREEGDKVR